MSYKFAGQKIFLDLTGRSSRNVELLHDAKFKKIFWIRNRNSYEALHVKMLELRYYLYGEQSEELYGRMQYIVEYRKKMPWMKSSIYIKENIKRSISFATNIIATIAFLGFLFLIYNGAKTTQFVNGYNQHESIKEQINSIEDIAPFDLTIGEMKTVDKETYIEIIVENSPNRNYKGVIKKGELKSIVPVDKDFNCEGECRPIWESED